MMRLVAVAGNSCLTIRALIVLLAICWLVKVRSLSTLDLFSAALSPLVSIA